MAEGSETIERAAFEDFVAAAPPELRERIGVRGETVGSAFVSAAAGLPASAIVVNRAIGLGVDAEETRATVERIVALYREAGVERYFVHLHPEARPDSLGAWLEAFGLERVRSWVKFTHTLSPPEERRTSLDLRPATSDDAEACGRIVADAFDLGRPAAPWVGALIGRPGWRVYMSFDGDAPAGVGTMFVRGRMAWLDWGATAPAFRGRGGQSALLALRVKEALAAGCTLIATETGEEVPGDPQHSYHNIVRAGFRPGVTRLNYAPPRRDDRPPLDEDAPGT